VARVAPTYQAPKKRDRKALMQIGESKIFGTYLERTPRSRELFEAARVHLPGGSTRMTLFHKPYPIYAAAGAGCMLRDVDGNSRIDYINNFTSLIHGHAHKDVVSAVMDQLPRGTAYASPTEVEIELAEEIKRRVPSVETMLFNNSGSEAVMGAVRAARAFTGRSKIAKFEGAYHGSYDYVAVSGKSRPGSNNDIDAPAATADSEGLHPSAVEDAVVMRFNSKTSVERALDAHGEELAAVLIEPICGSAGMIPAEPAFVAALRRETEERGILMICDEVIALRLGLGGGQGELGVRPDLTTMAKIIGGGFPIGAFWGRKDVMEVFSVGGGGPRALHLGTFNANPISARAGLATLRALDAAAFESLNALGEAARAALRTALASHKVAGQVTGAGSLFQVHFTDTPITDYRSAKTADTDAAFLLYLGMMNRGIQLASRGMGCLSTPMRQQHVDRLVEAFDATLQDLRLEGWIR
jgi:glutamate-1-semialdehyde 2,1-aminomutase